MKKRILLLSGIAISGAFLLPSHPGNKDHMPERHPSSSNQNNLANSKAIRATLPHAQTKALEQEILERAKCYESDSCDYPHTDPKSYHFALSHDLASLLAEYESQPADEQMQKIAIEMVKIQDGFVQEQALKLFTKLEPSPENLDAIINSLKYNPDPSIMEQAMSEMERYIGTSEEEKIQSLLADILAHGAQYSSERASELILAFINERSFDFFSRTLLQLDENTIAAQHLRTALREYQRKTVGG